MRMIAGLERPTSGDIVIDGNIVTGLPPRARNIAMVFQSYALYPHLTVEKNISFPLRAVGMPKDEIRKKVDWAAQMFGIQRFLDRKPRQLSGGERQRWRLRARSCESRWSFFSTSLCRISTPSCATPRVTS
jgi:multiple sugar transport system ATP-binding protein